MKRTWVAFAAVALVTMALPSQADAHCSGCGVAAGVIGGLAAGTIIGSAIAGPRYVEPAPVYVEPPPPPAYAEPVPPPPGPFCHSEWQQVWDGYAYYPERVRVCD